MGLQEPKAAPGVSGFTTSGWVEDLWEGESAKASAVLSSRREPAAVSSAPGGSPRVPSAWSQPQLGSDSPCEFGHGLFFL